METNEPKPNQQGLEYPPPAAPVDTPAPVAQIARIAPTQAPQADVEALDKKELEYLRILEAQNRQLTMDVGDAALVFDAKKALLGQHRQKMNEAYSNILRMRGIAEARFDTNTGVIHVVSRHQDRG